MGIMKSQGRGVFSFNLSIQLVQGKITGQLCLNSKNKLLYDVSFYKKLIFLWPFDAQLLICIVLFLSTECMDESRDL